MSSCQDTQAALSVDSVTRFPRAQAAGRFERDAAAKEPTREKANQRMQHMHTGIDASALAPILSCAANMVLITSSLVPGLPISPRGKSRDLMPPPANQIEPGPHGFGRVAKFQEDLSVSRD